MRTVHMGLVAVLCAACPCLRPLRRTCRRGRSLFD